MQWKAATIILLLVIAIFAFVFISGGSNTSNRFLDMPKENVTTSGGKQIVEIRAKGRYLPKVSNAKAGIPTVFRIKTNVTFDCSSALMIPSIGYRGNLPLTGTTDINVPAQKAGTSLQGICAMGMYNFSVNFN